MQIYGTIQGADNYALAIGNTAWGLLAPAEKNAALVRGSLYVDSFAKRWIDDKCWLQFIGEKTGGWAQDREWPRFGILGLPDNVIPKNIEYAAYEAALREAANPGSLNPDIDRTQLVKREKVDVLEVTYAVGDSANAADLQPVIPAIQALLSGFLARRCTNQMAVFTV